jgi:mercuric ion transport protein
MRIEKERHTRTESPTTVGRWFSAGSVLSAFAMGICCIGPILFVALGLSSFVSLWLLRHLLPYRNLFLILTIVLLGLGFYITYRKGRTVRRLDKGILWVSTLLVLALLGYSFSVEGFVLF